MKEKYNCGVCQQTDSNKECEECTLGIIADSLKDISKVLRFIHPKVFEDE